MAHRTAPCFTYSACATLAEPIVGPPLVLKGSGLTAKAARRRLVLREVVLSPSLWVNNDTVALALVV